MGQYYSEINLPPFPEELLPLSSLEDNVVPDIGYGRTYNVNGTSLIPAKYQFSIIYNSQTGQTADPKAFEWLRTISATPFKHMTMVQTAWDGNAHIVHSDLIRRYALNYWWDIGGDNVITSWYREKGKPLHRTKTVRDWQTDTGPVDYENLELLESVCFKPKTWYLMSTSVLHDVQNITGRRQGITVGFVDSSIVVNANPLFVLPDATR